MRYALLDYSTHNIGDEIQSIAASRFLPRVDTYIDRDAINRKKLSDDTKLILNGWFTHAPSGWPIQQPRLYPLFVSFHLSDRCGSDVRQLTSERCLAYYRKYGPIGCRDLTTMRLLSERRVPAYFSGCLTLTLENDSCSRSDEIYLVDVNDRVADMVPKHLRPNVRRTTHVIWRPRMSRYWFLRVRTRRWRFAYAQQLLSQYSRAKLVVTSRLHCALPCLAFGTPVVLVRYRPNDARHPGLKELLHTATLEDVRAGRLTIDWENPQPNPDLHQRLTSSLVNTCSEYMAAC